LVTVLYRFGGDWRVDAPPDTVASVLADLGKYPAWWPQVLAVASLGPDDARVLCRSTLPYTLDLVLTAVRRETRVLETAISGDLQGWVRWTLAHDGEGTHLRWEQQVDVTGPLALASYVARPLLRWNHGRMMAGGVAGLRAEVGRRLA
jgi:carbon monoxide dehydrogenase subunit G